MRNIMFGIGTGRCGTLSLKNILNECTDVYITHERPGMRRNFYQEMDCMDNLKMLKDLKMQPGALIGDIAHYHLPRIPFFVKELIKPPKIIHLRRDRQGMIDSWMRKCDGLSNCRPEDKNEILRKRGKHYVTAWYDTFPKFFGTKSSEEAWGKYWDFYEENVAILRKIDIEIITIEMEDLNKDIKLKNLFSYLEIPYDNIRLSKNRKFNSSL